MLTAAVVSADDVSSGYLRACLEQTGLVQAVVIWNHNKGEQGLGNAVPDVILLDLPRDPTELLNFASQQRRLRPQAQIVACCGSPQPDQNLLLQAMRAGVQELLPKPVNPGALQEILSRFLQESRTVESRAAEKAILVLGSKGGVGTSTVAVNLAAQLSLITRKRVVLLDLARPLGHAALLLDLNPRFSIRDAVENLERLDGHFFSGLLTKHKTGVEVLAGTSHPEEWNQIPIGNLPRILNVAQSTSDFVVIDLGSDYSQEWNSIFRLARMTLLVVESNVPSLWALERHLASVSALGLESDRVRIVVNRWDRGDEQVLRSVEKAVKRPIFARLPNDFRQVSEAISLGMPLSRNHSNSLVLGFRSLASRLAGLPEVQLPRGRGLNQLFMTRRGK